MARNRPIKILWYGSETDDEGNPIIPKISPSFEKRLEGLNEGEIYIHNDDNNPSIYIRTNKDRVVAISGGANISELAKYFCAKTRRILQIFFYHYLAELSLRNMPSSVISLPAY